MEKKKKGLYKLVRRDVHIVFLSEKSFRIMSLTKSYFSFALQNYTFVYN